MSGPTQLLPAAAMAVATTDRPAAVERRLRRQMGIAGLLVVLLLLLLLVDHLFLADETTSSPLFTEPVPVRKKELPPNAEPAPVETPAVPPVIAEPQATGAAIEARVAAAEAAAVGDHEDLSGSTATLRQAAALPRPLSGPGLQTSPFVDLRRAEEVQARFAQAGIPVGVEARLQVGPFRDRAEAEAARRELRAQGVEAVIRPSVRAAKP
ncbi:MAG TPA: SPOR domain-containing protein [Candidatus Accumulibacter phosphatis]|nr:MAG: Sporulation related domain protein [Candidatus Accumulibacter sp. SK-11]HAY27779.1 hypothetical protein [Accumulibacter sp.]HRL74909.1 SPOR domain-containing protein [Candidatus Accumulibacter phosphatis]HRQ93392.1 SPOR domain-containing protein [Candidatus Accumulibacter phosphatis]